MTRPIRLFSIAVLALGWAFAAGAHSGGTSAQGCHTDKSTGLWHCHVKTGTDATRPIPPAR